MGTKHGQGKKRLCVVCGDSFTRQGKKKTCSENCKDVFRQLRAMSKRNGGPVWTAEKRIEHGHAISRGMTEEVRQRISTKLTDRVVTKETSQKISLAVRKSIVEGRHKGWSPRNGDSYPEKFWMNVLDSLGISYTREFPAHGYFLDFKIGRVDLEIDGKHHEYEPFLSRDKIRDRTLIENGYLVHRIKWVPPTSYERKKKFNLELEKLKVLIAQHG